MKSQVIGQLLRITVRSAEQVAEAEAEYERRLEEQQRQMRLSAGENEADSDTDSLQAKPNRGTYRRERPKLGRNDPCWCGSGKKYKKCHMEQDRAKEAAAEASAP